MSNGQYERNMIGNQSQRSKRLKELLPLGCPFLLLVCPRPFGRRLSDKVIRPSSLSLDCDGGHDDAKGKLPTVRLGRERGKGSTEA